MSRMTSDTPVVDSKAIDAGIRPSIVIATLVGGLLILWSGLSTWRQYNRLRDFKGPRLASFSKWWLVKTVGSGRAYLDFWEVTKKYGVLLIGFCIARVQTGSIARIGPKDLITDDPDLMKHVLNVRTEYRRSDWYDGMRFDPANNNILSWRDEDEHFRLRSKMSAGYGGREVENLEPKIDKNILALVDLLHKYAREHKPVDLGRRAQFFTLDVISDLAFGAPFGFLETDSDVYEYIQTTEETLPMVMVTTVIPWLVKVLSSPIFKKLLPSEKDPLGFGRVMGIAKEITAERFGADKKVRRDMLGSFVAHGLTQKEAESEILLQIVAGSDTTATAIRSTLLHLITIPRVYHKLRAETSKTEYPDAVIPDNAARELPYLQAVIKEGLRIFPPVAGLMAKQVPPQGDTWKGRFIPGGTRIGYCAWGIFRREDLWGADAGEFRPERWIESPPDKIREMESALELIFSYGRWQCLGRPVALMELNKIFVEVGLSSEIGCVDADIKTGSCSANLTFRSVILQSPGRSLTVESSRSLSFGCELSVELRINLWTGNFDLITRLLVVTLLEGAELVRAFNKTGSLDPTKLETTSEQKEWALEPEEIHNGCENHAGFFRVILPTSRSESFTTVALSFVQGRLRLFKTCLVHDEPASILLAELLLVNDGSSKPVMALGRPLDRSFIDPSLCPSWDDQASSHRQINQMAAIFENAALSIISVDGRDADSGLRGLRHASEPRHLPPTLQLTPNTRISIRQETRLRYTPWSRRGWTLQEHIFSRRRVIFFENTMKWTCCSSVYYEDIDSPHDLPPKALYLYVAEGRESTNPLDFSLNVTDMSILCDLVSSYNGRLLTFEQDIMDAISSIFNAMKLAFPRGFIHGLPVSFFDISLL
ncbi:hypothetical protein FZEAL_6585 [Fusarium zealandicum]|uniref:Heterokaryon incompatibility domain-containing protein n=1 Tax=Fusarium zealandicum TaxID=1053134 RepID=A0A8H4UHH9_9HYPO|nr:hypothetical protein FZEAL_6585 [Fusarium zealandicum]